MISTERTAKGTTITIVKYDTYNNSWSTGGTTKGSTAGSTVGTLTNNDKNNAEIKNLSPWGGEYE